MPIGAPLTPGCAAVVGASAADEGKTEKEKPTTAWSVLGKDSFVLGAGTGLAYACAFAYEVGYSEALGVPPDLVEVNIGSMLAAAGLVLLLGFAAVVAWRMDWDDAGHPLGNSLKALVVFGALVAFLFGVSSRAAALYVGVCGAAVVGLGFIGALKPTAVFELRVAPGRWLLAALCCATLVGVSHETGANFAANRTDFFVGGKEPEMVLLRVYGGRQVLAPFDRAKKQLSGEIRVVSLDSAVPLRPASVGPLRR